MTPPVSQTHAAEAEQTPALNLSTEPTGPRREYLIRPRTGWISVDWRELWEARELLIVLISRDLKVRYKQTVLGAAWAIIQPLFAMLIFTVIFGNFAKIPSDGIPYAIFVFTGLLPWTLFSNSVSQASLSLVNQQAMLTKIYLPRLFVPAVPVASGLIDLAISALVLVALMFYFKITPGLGVLAIPFLTLIAVAAALGISLALAALTVTYRDFRYIIPFLVQLWMYLSPVIYPVSLVPKQYQPLLALNPMAGVIDAFRSSLLGTPWNWPALAVSTASALGFLIFGLFYFRRMERSFADVA